MQKKRNNQKTIVHQLKQEKNLMLGKIEGGRKGTTEDEMVGWHHRLDAHEFG